MANPASYNFGQPDQIDTPSQQSASGGFGNSEQDIDYEELGAGERPTIAPENQMPGELDQNAAEHATSEGGRQDGESRQSARPA